MYGSLRIILGGMMALLLATSLCEAKKMESGQEVDLPLLIYSECETVDEMPYAPTGWMGDTDAVEQDLCCRDKPHSGRSCIRIDFTSGGWWSGVAWQHPANDWGNLPGGYDLRKARKITFWARGLEGGEEITFKYAILGKDKAQPDSCEGKEKKIKLGKEWKQYRLSLTGDRRRIKTGFVWTTEVTDANLTFFLDDIQYE